jgi:hypothetical protein
VPLDSAIRLGFVSETTTTETFDAAKSTSKCSFIILQDAEGYQAYIMTIMADPAWLGADYSKLKTLSYRNKGEAFSGKVLYFSPKGRLLNGYRYHNGKVNGRVSAATPLTNDKQVQLRLKAETSKKVMATDCQTEVVKVLSSVICSAAPSSAASCTYNYDVYIIRTCYEMSDLPVTDDDGWVPPQGGGGATTTTTVEHESVVTVEPLIIINDLQDSCSSKVLQKLQSQDLNGEIADIISDVFNTSDKVNLTFNEFFDPNKAPAKSIISTKQGELFSEVISLNTAHVQNASQEFRAVLMIHESLHAYMNYNNNYYQDQLGQHQEMADKYVQKVKVLLQHMYSIDDQNAYSLILNGLRDAFGNNIPAYYNALKTKYNIDDPLRKYEYHRVGLSGTQCPPI